MPGSTHSVAQPTRKPTPAWPLQAAALLLLILVAYLPATNAGYVWDDDAYVTDNPLLSAPDGLNKIWFSREHPSQYFPLSYTTLRLGYHLWGLHPAGYHLLNIFMHCANALLIWAVLRRLSLPGAWFAAALFAVHPVQVETVAWISELKNLQSTFFYLLSLLSWIRFKESSRPGQWGFYGLSLLLYCLALLSKTTACTLPAALLLVLWLRKQPIGWRTVTEVAPFCLLGLGMGLLSIWWERQMGHYGDEFGLSFSTAERLLIAGRAVWFYAGKLILPFNLSFSYPRWQLNSHDPLQYGWVAASILVGIMLWLNRRRLGRGPIVAIAFFVATLSPMLGFIQNFTFRYSFVADHYQYLACAGLLALIAAGVTALVTKNWFSRRGASVLSGVILAGLAGLTWLQCGAYKDLETLMRDIIAKNPKSWMAHTNLGLCYLDRGQTQEAITCFSRAIELNSRCFEAFNNRGLALAAEGRFDAAIEQYRKAVEINPRDFSAYNNIGMALAAQGKMSEAVEQYEQAIGINSGFLNAHLNLAMALQRARRGGEAIASYRSALALNPECSPALNNLAWLLATHPDPALRNGREALRLAETAQKIEAPGDPLVWATLAAAYAENARYAEAVASAKKAAELARAAGDQKLADKYSELIQLFSSGQPLRDQGEPDRK